MFDSNDSLEIAHSLEANSIQEVSVDRKRSGERQRSELARIDQERSFNAMPKISDYEAEVQIWLK